MFDDIYKKHGYSFKVPADVKTVDEIRPYLEGGRGKGKMLRLLAAKAPRIFGIPAAAYLGYQALQPGEVQAEEVPIKYNDEIGAFVAFKHLGLLGRLGIIECIVKARATAIVPLAEH